MTSPVTSTTIRFVSAPGETPLGGELNAAVARAVVRIHRDYVGRGPTRAKAFFRNDVLVVLLEDAMTPIERSLAAGARGDAVREMREEFAATMRDPLVEAVELITGCKVTALMSDSHLDPDMETHLFVLDRPVPSTGPAAVAGRNGR